MVGANVSLLLSPGFIRDIHHTLSLKQKQAISPVRIRMVPGE